MNDPDRLLACILKFKAGLEEQDMSLPPGLAGMYGELLAYKKIREVLQVLGAEVIFFSGQNVPTCRS